MLKRWAGLATLLLCWLAVTTPVLAHANLLRAVPAPNSTSAQAPGQLELFFSEPIDPAASSVQLLAASGEPVVGTELRVDTLDASIVRVSLPPLEDGIYTVAWAALSTVDGHLTRGVYPIAIGEDQLITDADRSANRPGGFNEARPLDVLARMLGLVGGSILAGGFALHLLLWRPVRERDGFDHEAADHRLARLLYTGLLLLLANFIVVVIALALERGSLLAVGAVLGSRVGYGLLARLLFMGMLLFAAREVAKGSFIDLLTGLFFSAGLLLVNTLFSHSAALEESWMLAVLNHWIHLLAASIWIGGLVYFLFILVPALRELPADDRGAALLEMIRRFSPLGAAAVVALAMTGIFSSQLHIGSMEGLRDTAYGQTLLAKLALSLPLLILAFLNLRHGRRARRDGGGADQGFVKRLRAESVIGLSVLAVAALLAGLGPARTVIQARQSEALTLSQVADPLRAQLTLTPPRPGPMRFDVRLTDGNGQPYEIARRVRLKFTPPDSSLGQSETLAELQEDGRYIAEGAYLSLTGPWQIELQVQRPDGYDAFARYNLLVTREGIQAALSARPAFRTEAWLPWGFAATGGLLALWGAGMWTRADQRGMGSLVVSLGALLLLTGALSVAQPPVLPEAPVITVNPIPPTQASLGRGASLYEENCARCHGESGLGDGPAGDGLIPAPANLIEHVPFHDDGELFGWISNGVPDTAMPAYKDSIVEEDRWHIVNFLRTLSAE